MNVKVSITAILIAVSGLAHASELFQKEMLYGEWQCTFNDAESGISGQSIDTYHANGKGTTQATMTIQGIKLEIDGTSNWSMTGDKIHGKVSQVNATSRDNPELARHFESIQSNMQSTARIIRLTNSTLVLQEDLAKLRVHCRR